MKKNTQLILIGMIGWVLLAAVVVAADTNEVVFRVQENLKKLGYYKAAVDGLVGLETHKAILLYQYDMNLPVTGQFDEATVKYLLRPPIIFNTQDFAPFHYASIEGGGIGGPVPQIIKLACQSAGFNSRIVMYENWKQAQDDVKAGKAEGLFVIAWNSEREKWLHRSTAIIETEYGLFVHKDDHMQMADVHEQPSRLDG